MEKLKERLGRIRKQDVLLWLVVVAVLFLTIQVAPPHERWKRGQRILLLATLIYCSNRTRKKL